MQSNGTLISDDWRGGYEGFPVEEMACKCGCGMLPKHSLMIKLVKLREEVGPLPISSGARCAKHNMKVSDTGSTGPHVLGLAADITASGARALKILAVAIRLGFKGFGIQQKGAKRFIHLDTVPTRGDGQIWSY